MKKASELLEESAHPFDSACIMVREMEAAIKDVMSHMRDPSKGVLFLGLRDTDASREALYRLFKMVDDKS